MNSVTRALAIQGRAEIIWGKSPELVRQSLRGQGLAESEIQTIVESALQERKIEIRRRGIQDVCYGSLAALGAIPFIIALLPLHGYRTSRLWILPAGLAALAVWLIGRGVMRLTCTNLIEGSLTEME